MTTTLSPRKNKASDLLTSTERVDQELAALTTEEVLDRLEGFLITVVESVVLASRCLYELERREISLESLANFPLARYLLRVAHHEASPEAVVMYNRNLVLLDRVTRLPLALQRKVIDGEPLLLVVFSPDGGYTNRLVSDPLDLKAQEINQIFSGSEIRTEQQQIIYLERKRSNGFTGGIKIDVPVTCEQAESLTKRAKREDKSPAQLLIEAAIACGFLPNPDEKKS